MLAFVKDSEVQCFESHPQGCFGWRNQEGLCSCLRLGVLNITAWNIWPSQHKWEVAAGLVVTSTTSHVGVGLAYGQDCRTEAWFRSNVQFHSTPVKPFNLCVIVDLWRLLRQCWLTGSSSRVICKLSCCFSWVISVNCTWILFSFATMVQELGTEMPSDAKYCQNFLAFWQLFCTLKARSRCYINW
jgi:hypothetical protein